MQTCAIALVIVSCGQPIGQVEVSEVIQKLKTGYENHKKDCKLLQGTVKGRFALCTKGQFSQKMAWSKKIAQTAVAGVVVEATQVEAQGKVKDETVAFGRNSKYSFRIHKKEEWILRAFDLQPLGRVVQGNRTVDEEILSILSPHYVLVNNMLIVSLLEAKNLRITSANVAKDANGSIAVVDYEVGKKGTHESGHYAGRMLCHLEYGAIIKNEATFYKSGGGKYALLITNDLDTSPAGKGRVKRTTQKIDYGGDFREVEQEFNLIVNPHTDETECTLSAFGLPEPQGVVWGESRSWHWYLLLFAAVLLSGWMYLRSRKANTETIERASMNRTGFSLVELVVVLAIIAIVGGMAISSVQKARQAAVRLECANNLKQIGLAVHAFHGSYHGLPPGMRWQNGTDSMPLSSWLVQILSFIELEPDWLQTVGAYKQSPNPKNNPPHVCLARPVRLFACPSDARVSHVQFAPRDKINVALTSYLGVSGKDWSTRDGVLFRDSRIRFADISDGTSNTLLAGERPPSADFQFGWWYAGAGQKFTGSADMILGVYEQNLQLVTAGSCPPGNYPFMPGSFSNQCDMFHFWSPHSGGAHFLFCDGSVRFLSYSAAPVMPALASRAGGETVEP